MKRIRVLINYGGKDTNERRIEPGEYDLNDERLFGVGERLLANGQAVDITPAAEEPEPTTKKPRK